MWREAAEDCVTLTKCCVLPKRLSSFTTRRPSAKKIIPGLSRLNASISKTNLSLLSETPFTYNAVKDRGDIFNEIAGLENEEFLFLVDMIRDSIASYNLQRLSGHIRNKVKNFTLMTLMKFRFNMTEKHLSTTFKVPEEAVQYALNVWIRSLHTDIFQLTVDRSELEPIIPIDGFPIRMMIDIVEVCASVDDSIRRDQMIQRNFPFKAVLGVQTNGQVCFASQLYSVLTSNESILDHCQIAYYFRPGDTVLINPAYEEALGRVTSHLHDVNINCSTDRAAFTTVLDKVLPKFERRIEEIKKFEILSAIPDDWINYGSAIWQICATLSNLKRV